MSGLWPSLAQVAAVLLAAGAIGYALAVLFVPSSRRPERAAWGFALGLSLLAASVPLAFLTHMPPRWTPLLLAVFSLATTWFLRRASSLSPRGGARGVSPRLASAPAVAAGHASREAGVRQG